MFNIVTFKRNFIFGRSYRPLAAAVMIQEWEIKSVNIKYDKWPWPASRRSTWLCGMWALQWIAWSTHVHHDFSLVPLNCSPRHTSLCIVRKGSALSLWVWPFWRTSVGIFYFYPVFLCILHFLCCEFGHCVLFSCSVFLHMLGGREKKRIDSQKPDVFEKQPKLEKVHCFYCNCYSSATQSCRDIFSSPSWHRN